MASGETPYVPSTPPADPRELHWWLHNEMLNVHRALNELRTSQGTWNNYKWDDERFPANELFLRPGASLPSMTYIYDTQIAVFKATDSSTAALHFIHQLSHAWQEESTLGPHIHTVNHAALSGDVVWGLTYRWFNGNNDTVPTSTAVTVTQTLSGTADKVTIVSFPGPHKVGMKISSFFIGKFYRLGGDAADTLAGNVGVLEYDNHIKKNSDGSRQLFIK